MFNVDMCTVKPVCNGHPWDQQKWLLYRGDLLYSQVSIQLAGLVIVIE